MRVLRLILPIACSVILPSRLPAAESAPVPPAQAPVAAANQRGADVDAIDATANPFELATTPQPAGSGNSGSSPRIHVPTRFSFAAFIWM
jgi:hypothetical protein